MEGRPSQILVRASSVFKDFKQEPSTPKLAPTAAAPGTQMHEEAVRLASFGSGWPHEELTPAKLAKAGFYYAPSSHIDRCVCFACGSALFNWDPSDDPMSEHRQWYGHCPFVLGQPTKNVPLESAVFPLLNRSKSLSSVAGHSSVGLGQSSAGPSQLHNGKGLNGYVQSLQRSTSQSSFGFGGSDDYYLDEKANGTPNPAMDGEDGGEGIASETLLAKIERAMLSRESSTPSGLQDVEPVDKKAGKRRKSSGKETLEEEKKTALSGEKMELEERLLKQGNEVYECHQFLHDTSDHFVEQQFNRISESETKLQTLIISVRALIRDSELYKNTLLPSKRRTLSGLRQSMEDLTLEHHRAEKEVEGLVGRTADELTDLLLLRQKERELATHCHNVQKKKEEMAALKEMATSLLQQAISLEERKGLIAADLVDVKDTTERRRVEVEAFERKSLVTWSQRETALTLMVAERRQREASVVHAEQEMRAKEEWLAKKEGEMRCTESMLLNREKKVKELEMLLSKSRGDPVTTALLLSKARTDSFSEKRSREKRTTPPPDEIDFKLPLWIPDDAVLHCMLCRIPFNFFLRRRHHCRICGRVCCGECSEGKYYNIGKIRRFGYTEPVRVCVQCRGYLDES